MANVSMQHPASLRGSRMQDWALVVLAVWLFISPWVLYFGSAASNPGTGGANTGPAAWNAWIIGVILFVVGIAAPERMRASREWAALGLGVWLFIAPWVLGFVRLPKASWDHWIVGIVVFLIALSSLSVFRAVPAGTTATPPPRQPPMT
jgi:hypothetical protein